MNHITPDRLRELLDYDQTTGVFCWREGRRGHVKAGRACNYVNSHGYVEIKIDGVKYQAHRLAWLWCTGTCPDQDIDHINGVRTDNRFSNLRDVPRQINLQNQRSPKPGKASGLPLGVFKVANRFIARIQTNGHNTNLGRFDSPDAAHLAYLNAKRQLHEGNTL